MNILVDENIPGGPERFASLGRTRTMPGRAITRADVADVDLLFVRSVTPINARLLDGTRVQFVATATAGTDHVDQEYLRERGIAFASAPGSNAAAVADYVTVALLVLAGRRGIRLRERTIGIVGHGQVGSRVAARARALGMQVLVNDPPLARKTGNPACRPLGEVLEGADIVTLHCSLTRSGPDPSFHLADSEFFERLRPGCLFLNAARGEVAEDKALLRALESGRIADAVLDVWNDEPAPAADLLRRAALASPHIGGYSVEGKWRGAQMVYESACRFLGRAPHGSLLDAVAPPAPLIAPGGSPSAEVEGGAAGRDPQEAALEVARQVYDIETDTRAMRELADLAPLERGTAFDRLRRRHGPRHEFAFHTVLTPPKARGLRTLLDGLGFQVRTSGTPDSS